MGVINTIFTLINPIILFYIPEAEKEVGLMGVTLISASVFSALGMIVILRHLRELKFLAIVTAALSSISLVLFILGLQIRSVGLLYTSAISLGMFSTAFQTIGFEFAFETTFPESDGTVSGVLNISTQLFGIFITNVIAAVNSSAGHLIGNMLLVAFQVIGIFCLLFTKCELKRFLAYQTIDAAAKHLRSDENSAQQQEIVNEKTPLLMTTGHEETV